MADRREFRRKTSVRFDEGGRRRVAAQTPLRRAEGDFRAGGVGDRISPAGPASILANIREGERLTLRGGGAEGVGAFVSASPEEGFSPVEEEVAFVEPTAPVTPAPGEPGATPVAEVGTPGWARAEMSKINAKHEKQVVERKRIVDDAAATGSDLATLKEVLESKGLDKLKEPKHEKWLIEMAQATPSPTELKGAALEKMINNEQLSETEERLVARELADPDYGLAVKMVMQDPELSFAPVKERMTAIDDLYDQIRTGRAGGADAGGAVTPPPGIETPGAPAGGTGELDDATAQSILAEAGGDPDVARQIARQRGLRF